MGGPGPGMSSVIEGFQMEFTVTDKISVIVMTVVGTVPGGGDERWNQTDAPPAPLGFCWEFVPEGPPAVQIRSILRMDVRAVVVWVGAGDAVDRGAKLISRLLGAGLPSVIAIAEAHGPSSESALRQTGAIYLCGNEAQQRLGQLLQSILGSPATCSVAKPAASARKIRMDAS